MTNRANRKKWKLAAPAAGTNSNAPIAYRHRPHRMPALYPFHSMNSPAGIAMTK